MGLKTIFDASSKHMRKSILINLTLITGFLGVAQQENHLSFDKLAQGAGGEQMSREVASQLRAKRSESNVMKGDFIGSPFLADNFVNTSLFYDGELEKKIYYRFNAYNQEIEIKASGDPAATVFAVNKDKKISIDVNKKKMSFKTFVTSQDRTLNGYLINLLDGEAYDLYKRIYTKYSPGRPSPNSFLPPVPARFTNFTEYYFQKKGVNRIDEIILNNKKLLKQLDKDTRDKTKPYLKDNDLNIKEEGDLVKAFEFLNTRE